MSSMIGAAGRERAVDGERPRGCGRGHGAGEMARQKLPRASCLAPLQLEPRRHGMAAALDQQPLMHGVPDHARQDRRRRSSAPSPVPCPSGSQACDEGRQAEALGDAAGDEAEQALVPALGGEPDEAGVADCSSARSAAAKASASMRSSMAFRSAFSVSSLPAMARASLSSSAASSLAPRPDAPTLPPALMRGPEDEAERVAGRRLVDAGGVGERAQALALCRSRKTLSPLATSARFTPLSGTTSHTVASATRSSRPSRSGSALAAIEAVAAQRARGGDEEQKNDAGGGEMPLAGEIVLPVGIEHGECRGQRLVGLVMVDDDDFRAGSVGGLDGGLGGGAAIDGEDEPGTLLGKPGKRRRRRAVAFGEAIGDIGRGASVRARAGSAGPAPPKPRRRRRSRRIRRSARLRRWRRRSARPLSPCPVGLPGRAGDVLSDGSRKRESVAAIGAARGKQPPEQLRQTMGLGDGAAMCGAAGIEPLGPAQAARRPLHAEKGGGRLMVHLS